MKKIRFTTIALFLFVGTQVFGQYHERDWKWEPYATLTKGNKTFMIVYYGTLIKDYNGEVRWRFENRAAKPLFKVKLGIQKYTLKNGDVVEKNSCFFKTRRLSPGESAMTLPIMVEKEKFSGIEKVEVIENEIVVDFKTGKTYNWKRLGKIEVSTQ